MGIKIKKVGIAGYGIIGKRRRHYIDNNPYLKTIAVCDQNLENNVLGDGVKCFSNYQKLLAEPLDLLFVCLPNYLTPEVTIAGLEKGMHIFCEKPPGRNVQDIENVFKVKQKFPKLHLKYGFNHRYHDSVRDALDIIKSEKFGKIIYLRGVYGKSIISPFNKTWRSKRKYAGGGILLDQGIHIVDLMQLFCDEFVEVKSFISNSFWKCDVEDNVYAIMRSQNGVVGTLHSSATQWQHRFSLEIGLEEGYLELRGILSGTRSYGEEKLIIGKRKTFDSLTGTDQEEITTYLIDHSWSDEINELAEVITNGGSIKSGSVEDALKTMKLVYKIYWEDSKWRETNKISNPYDDR